MKRQRKNSWIFALCQAIGLLFVMVMLAGCTLAGFIIGSNSDSKKNLNSFTVSIYEIYRIDKGDLVEIRTKDGPILKGNFLGMEHIGQESIDLVLLKRKDHILKIKTSAIEEIVVLAQAKTDTLILGALGATIDAIVVSLVLKSIFSGLASK